MLGRLLSLEGKALCMTGTAVDGMRGLMLFQNILQTSAEITIIATKCAPHELVKIKRS